MSLPVLVRPEAENDIRSIRVELETVQQGLGDKFALRLAELLQRIEFMPGLYGLVWRRVRAARVKKFRYVVYYIEYADRVEVLAVMHGSRDASAWRKRV
jgi:plasmid stabilization system protein ParE